MNILFRLRLMNTTFFQYIFNKGCQVLNSLLILNILFRTWIRHKLSSGSSQGKFKLRRKLNFVNIKNYIYHIDLNCSAKFHNISRFGRLISVATPISFYLTNSRFTDTGSNDTGSNDTGSNDTGSNDKGSKARQRVKWHRVKKCDKGANFF